MQSLAVKGDSFRGPLRELFANPAALVYAKALTFVVFCEHFFVSAGASYTQEAKPVRNKHTGGPPCSTVVWRSALNMYTPDSLREYAFTSIDYPP